MNSYNKIDKAFRRLPILSGKEELLSAAIKMIAAVDFTEPEAIAAKYKTIGLAKTKKELESLANKAEALAKCLDELHEPAILALANNRACGMNYQLPNILRYLSERVKTAELSNVDEKSAGGKPEDKRAQAVGIMLAYNYNLLTGKKPTMHINPYTKKNTPAGPFYKLTKDVCKALNLSVNAEYIARSAADKYKDMLKELTPYS